jgi:enhancing lycopene biosynthesis protein 2
MAARVGVVLSGCGFMDGTEIHEAVSILIALDRRGAQIMCIAPQIPQRDVVNHASKKAEAETRNVLVESARIARGKIMDIASVSASDLEALIFPGGFGAAKNLSSFAVDGANCTVNKDVEQLIRAMHAARKPIGLACIAPVIAAKVLGDKHPKLTIGSDHATANAINQMGGEHHVVGETDIVVDEENRLVSTPCYMNNVGPWTVYQGAEKLVEEVLRMSGDISANIRTHMANQPQIQTK